MTRRKPRWTIYADDAIFDDDVTVRFTHREHDAIVITVNSNGHIVVVGAAVAPSSNNALRLTPNR